MPETTRLATLARGCAAALAIAIAPALADEVTRVNVQFAPGNSGATYGKEIRGYASVDYLLRASAGQTMRVTLTPSNPSNYFNVYAPGADAAMFIGSTSGNSFTGRLPSSGEYRVQVYLMRNAARRNETSDYRVHFEIDGAPAASSARPSNDYADGLAGGPDYWAISGVASNDRLNIRSGPSPRDAVVARLNNGTVVKNLGCRMTGGQRWCRVQLPTTDGTEGWAAGRYLRESGAPF